MSATQIDISDTETLFYNEENLHLNAEMEPSLFDDADNLNERDSSNSSEPEQSNEKGRLHEVKQNNNVADMGVGPSTEKMGNKRPASIPLESASKMKCLEYSHCIQCGYKFYTKDKHKKRK